MHLRYVTSSARISLCNRMCLLTDETDMERFGRCQSELVTSVTSITNNVEQLLTNRVADRLPISAYVSIFHPNFLTRISKSLQCGIYNATSDSAQRPITAIHTRRQDTTRNNLSTLNRSQPPIQHEVLHRPRPELNMGCSLALPGIDIVFCQYSQRR